MKRLFRRPSSKKDLNGGSGQAPRRTSSFFSSFRKHKGEKKQPLGPELAGASSFTSDSFLLKPSSTSTAMSTTSAASSALFSAHDRSLHDQQTSQQPNPVAPRSKSSHHANANNNNNNNNIDDEPRDNHNSVKEILLPLRGQPSASTSTSTSMSMSSRYQSPQHATDDLSASSANDSFHFDAMTACSSIADAEQEGWATLSLEDIAANPPSRHYRDPTTGDMIEVSEDDYYRHCHGVEPSRPAAPSSSSSSRQDGSSHSTYSASRKPMMDSIHTTMSASSLSSHHSKTKSRSRSRRNLPNVRSTKSPRAGRNRSFGRHSSDHVSSHNDLIGSPALSSASYHPGTQRERCRPRPKRGNSNSPRRTMRRRVRSLEATQLPLGVHRSVPSLPPLQSLQPIDDAATKDPLSTTLHAALDEGNRKQAPASATSTNAMMDMQQLMDLRSHCQAMKLPKSRSVVALSSSRLASASASLLAQNNHRAGSMMSMRPRSASSFSSSFHNAVHRSASRNSNNAAFTAAAASPSTANAQWSTANLANFAAGQKNTSSFSNALLRQAKPAANGMSSGLLQPRMRNDARNLVPSLPLSQQHGASLLRSNFSEPLADEQPMLSLHDLKSTPLMMPKPPLVSNDQLPRPHATPRVASASIMDEEPMLNLDQLLTGSASAIPTKSNHSPADELPMMLSPRLPSKQLTKASFFTGTTVSSTGDLRSIVNGDSLRGSAQRPNAPRIDMQTLLAGNRKKKKTLQQQHRPLSRSLHSKPTSSPSLSAINQPSKSPPLRRGKASSSMVDLDDLLNQRFRSSAHSPRQRNGRSYHSSGSLSTVSSSHHHSKPTRRMLSTMPEAAADRNRSLAGSKPTPRSHNALSSGDPGLMSVISPTRSRNQSKASLSSIHEGRAMKNNASRKNAGRNGMRSDTKSNQMRRNRSQNHIPRSPKKMTQGVRRIQSFMHHSPTRSGNGRSHANKNESWSDARGIKTTKFNFKPNRSLPIDPDTQTADVVDQAIGVATSTHSLHTSPPADSQPPRPVTEPKMESAAFDDIGELFERMMVNDGQNPAPQRSDLPSPGTTSMKSSNKPAVYPTSDTSSMQDTTDDGSFTSVSARNAPPNKQSRPVSGNSQLPLSPCPTSSHSKNGTKHSTKQKKKKTRQQKKKKNKQQHREDPSSSLHSKSSRRRQRRYSSSDSSSGHNSRSRRGASPSAEDDDINQVFFFRRNRKTVTPPLLNALQRQDSMQRKSNLINSVNEVLDMLDSAEKGKAASMRAQSSH